ncbi:MAG: hypothetical protein J6A27_09595 [Bacteroidales bacterium]|nr:hypothetical protein [Bacteroidales bacterium]
MEKKDVFSRIRLLCTLLCGLFGLLLCCCTVLEERDGCTNTLTVDLQGVEKGIKEWQMWLFNGEGKLLFKDTIYRRSYSSPYKVEVPRASEVRCLMWGNMRGATRVVENYSYGTNFTKAADISADSIYFFTDTITTAGEDSYLKVVPDKEFATVDIYVNGWVGSDFEADMVLECASDGFYVGKEFLRGRSFINAQVAGIGNYYTRFQCRMLRQQDTENMVLNLYIRDLLADGTLGRVAVDKEIPIGEYLQENGYDMQKKSLEDIVMEVDYSFNKFVIKAADWEATYKMDEEI